ncbi:hypothetical protein SCYAM73S_03340 [Streptomyces cyaneofuscatus]
MTGTRPPDDPRIGPAFDAPRMSWTRGSRRARGLCPPPDRIRGLRRQCAREPAAGASPTPVGRLLDAPTRRGGPTARWGRGAPRRRHRGAARRRRQLGRTPDRARLPFLAGRATAGAVPGRGLAHLYLDGHLVARSTPPATASPAGSSRAARTSSPPASTPTTAPSGPSTANPSRARPTSPPRPPDLGDAHRAIPERAADRPRRPVQPTRCTCRRARFTEARRKGIMSPCPTRPRSAAPPCSGAAPNA